MTPDPIVEEVRKAGEAYLAKFGYDLELAFEDLRRHAKERGVLLVARQPKRPAKRPAPVVSKAR